MSTPFDQLGLGTDLLGLTQCVPSQPGMAMSLRGHVPMDTSGQRMPAAVDHPAAANPRVTDSNIDRLGRVLAAECGPQLCSFAERQAVGSTVINRMNKRGTDNVSDVAVKGQYAMADRADSDSLALARALLAGQITDNTDGAMNFYSPKSMPKEGQSTKGWDVGSDMEYVPGTGRQTMLKNYIPSWVGGLQQRVIPGVSDWHLKVYGPASGSGQ